MNQRDEKGRWVNGHIAIPNWNSEINRLRKLIYTNLTNKKADAICKKLIEMGIAGDKGAIELLFNYCGLKWKEEKLSSPDDNNHDIILDKLKGIVDERNIFNTGKSSVN